MKRSIRFPGLRRLLWVVGVGIASAAGMGPVQAQQMCGGKTYPFPYTDVSGVGAPFCPGIMEAYVTAVTKGTSPTTFSPNESVVRLQMTTFLQRSLDQGLKRTSRRGPLNQWWTPQTVAGMQTIVVGPGPAFCAADGDAIWTSSFNGGEVVEIQASSGKVINLFGGAVGPEGILVAGSTVFIAGHTSPGSLYVIDREQAASLTLATSALGNQPLGIAFDGSNVWTANSGGSVSIITPAATTPYPPGNVTTVTTGFTSPLGILYDGAHIWVTDQNAGKLFELDSSGTILQTVTVGNSPQSPGFDGTNIWVPNATDNSITVVQASSGNVVATINADASNQLNSPAAVSFDGERMLVTNHNGNSVTLFKASDLSFIANVPMPLASSFPLGACSDGINFWVPLHGLADLLRF